MLIKVNIAKFHIKQSARNSHFIVGLKKFPFSCRGRARRKIYGRNSVNERAIDSQTSSHQKRKETNQDGALLTSLPVADSRSFRKLFNLLFLSSLSILSRLSLFPCFSLSPLRTLSGSQCREAYRINIKRIQYLRIRT